MGGRVLAVDGDEVTLVYGDQSVAVVPAAALARNAWDPAGDGSPPPVGTKSEVLDYLAEIVEVPTGELAVPREDRVS